FYNFLYLSFFKKIVKRVHGIILSEKKGLMIDNSLVIADLHLGIEGVLEEKGVNIIKADIDLSKTEVPSSKLNLEKGYNFTGLMIAKGRIASRIVETIGKSKSDEKWSNLISLLKETVESVSYHLLTVPIYTVNSPWNILYASRGLLSRVKDTKISSEADVSPSSVIEGPVIIEAGAKIDHGAIIKGPVYIGENTLVGANSFVRNSVSIERSSVIGALAEVKRSYIGPGATVGSHSHVSDTVIGAGASIRPMTVTLNYNPQEAAKIKEYEKRGAVIGEGSIVDGGTLLRPGATINPGSVYPS
ncbi:MAG: hypothetical protein DSY42_01050, partial [Aquifex sp.]